MERMEAIKRPLTKEMKLKERKRVESMNNEMMRGKLVLSAEDMMVLKASEVWKEEPTKIRKELTEKAFRKYEEFIAMGLEREEYWVDPTLMPRMMNAATWVARFNDAKRGFKLYNYVSSLIPRGHDVNWVKAEVDGMMVRVWNEWMKRNKGLVNAISGTLEGEVGEAVENVDPAVLEQVRKEMRERVDAAKKKLNLE